MNCLYTITFVFFTFLSVIPYHAQATGDEWDVYLENVETYTVPGNQNESKPNRITNTSRKIRTPKPLPNGATPQQISDYNQSMQKAKREKHQIEMLKIYESLDSLGDVSNNKTSPATPKPKPLPPIKRHSGYSERKVSFNWGGKISGYEFADYEFKFESTNQEHVELMSKTVSTLSEQGWEVDLNRSFQRVEGNLNSSQAHTTTQMRFRRKK